MRITVDHDKCCGIGNCTMTAPAVFDQDEKDGTVILLQHSPPAEIHDLVRRAVGVCPCEAIKVDE
ncbi:ferredoxin [Kibdelosporangium aridum]|uniref:Ferredoxin n=1 Tax=Kibdelosporangium aridum TaxID=2030 RepID=A0A428ZS92_KIBAR|nr:ferredoxin [Kibdelosporangium aridum]RSM90861.1 ferredoxin [Kibdelosporangium aridum]